MSIVKVSFGNQQLEVISIEHDKERWMLANPFARILEYSNYNKAVRIHVSVQNQICLEEIRVAHNGPITSSIHPMSKFINRAGLFELIQGSKMPKAQEFKQWVNSDLLVKLCNDGEYKMVTDAPMEIAQGMNAVYSVTNDGKEAPWKQDLDQLSAIVEKKNEQICSLSLALKESNEKVMTMATALVTANAALIDANKDITQLANRMADIAQDVIAKPSDPQLLHSLAVCAMGGDQYAFVRPQKRSLKRSLDRLAVEERDIVFKSDYVPNGVNVLNKVKEALPKEKFTARHNKITLLEDMTKDELVNVIESTMTSRQLALAKKRL